jgi:hypothetical protein
MQSVLQGMPHVQRSSYIRRRDYYRKARLCGSRIRKEKAFLLPEGIPFVLKFFRFIRFGERFARHFQTFFPVLRIRAEIKSGILCELLDLV